MKKIAILGATSQIAKSLIINACNSGKYRLFLFARSPDRALSFLKEYVIAQIPDVFDLEAFPQEQYDLLVNCVGISDPGKQRRAGAEIFFVTEKYDNLVISYLDKNPKSLYINFSSGAVYGTSFALPPTSDTKFELLVNQIQETDYYRIAKLNAEAKHRALKRNIVDMRLFSFFSRFLDFSSRFFMTEVMRSLVENKELVTSRTDMMRDYVDQEDLFRAVELCIEHKPINEVFDVFSLKPVSKMEIIDLFRTKYGLKVRFEKKIDFKDATGVKDSYYPTNKRLEGLGYFPKFTSIDCLQRETEAILKIHQNKPIL
jgi:nucleoside-diphosphate-sugar epimerase